MTKDKTFNETKLLKIRIETGKLLIGRRFTQLQEIINDLWGE